MKANWYFFVVLPIEFKVVEVNQLSRDISEGEVPLGDLEARLKAIRADEIILAGTIATRIQKRIYTKHVAA